MAAAFFSSAWLYRCVTAAREFGRVWTPEKSDRDAGKPLVMMVMVVVIRVECVCVHEYIYTQMAYVVYF